MVMTGGRFTINCCLSSNSEINDNPPLDLEIKLILTHTQNGNKSGRKQAMWHRVQTSSRPSFLAMEPIFMAQDHNDTESLVTITGNPHQKNIKILDTISSSPMCFAVRWYHI